MLLLRLLQLGQNEYKFFIQSAVGGDLVSRNFPLCVIVVARILHHLLCQLCYEQRTLLSIHIYRIEFRYYFFLLICIVFFLSSNLV